MANGARGGSKAGERGLRETQALARRPWGSLSRLQATHYSRRGEFLHDLASADPPIMAKIHMLYALKGDDSSEHHQRSFYLPRLFRIAIFCRTTSDRTLLLTKAFGR